MNNFDIKTFSQSSIQNTKVFEKNDESVDSYFEKIGFKPFIIFLVVALSMCYSTTGGIIQSMSIHNQFPNRTCKNNITLESIHIANENEELQKEQCESQKDSADWDCLDEDLQPMNITKQFELECTPDMRMKFAYIGGLQNVAMMFGALFMGPMMDYLGRRSTCILGSVLMATCMVLCCICTDQWYFLISFSMIGFFGEFFYIPAQVLATELVSKKQSTIIGVSLNVLDALNGLLFVVIYYFVQDFWQMMYITIGRVFVLFLILVFLTMESPYLLQVQNKVEQCNKALWQYAQKCGVDEIPDVASPINEDSKDKETKIGQTTWTAGLFFNLVLNGFLWMSVVCIFYQMFYYTKYFPTELYTTLCLESFAVGIGGLISGLSMNNIGNKKTLCFAFLTVIVTMLIQDNVLEQEQFVYSIIFINILMASIVFNVIQVMPPLQFYGDILGIVQGFVNVLGRMGGMIAPFASEYQSPNMILVLSSLLGLSCTIFIRNQKWFDAEYLLKLKENEQKAANQDGKFRSRTQDNLIAFKDDDI